MDERVAGVVCALLGVIAAITVLADLPPATWVNQLQARYSGEASPKVTVAVLGLGLLGVWAVSSALIGSLGRRRGRRREES